MWSISSCVLASLFEDGDIDDDEGEDEDDEDGVVTFWCAPVLLSQTAGPRDFSPGLQCFAQDWSEPEKDSEDKVKI